ncbi:MAG TPA: hypothetical protein EYG31_13700 [Porticoccaceae bacterium]|jgi:hypothetical protein|nr:hypothetical protein [Gammaproteobacteria bacterium]HIL61676.1 hypothetical protein [Porticoccaceae bacterium]
MLNFFFKSGLILFISLWLKPRLKGIVYAICVIAGIWLIQGEYLDYLSLINDFTYAGWTYLAKWMAIVITVVLYYYFVEVPIKNAAASNDKGFSASGLDIGEEKRTIDQSMAEKDDGFNFLRKKKQLKNRSQKILEE